MASRVIYQSQGVMVSDTITSATAAEHSQIFRVQQFNHSSESTRVDANEFGQLAAIDRINIDPPTVSISMQYYLTEGFNEESLGFTVNRGKTASAWTENNSFLGEMLKNAKNAKNVFLLIDNEGVDANRTGVASGLADDQIGVGCLGFGNASVTDYTASFNVGEFPTVDVSLEGSNTIGDLIAEDKSVPNPSIDTATGDPLTGKSILAGFQKFDPVKSPKITALRPGDIDVELTGVDGITLFNFTNDPDKHAYIQSASISIPLSRTGLRTLGIKYNYARVIDFPLTATVQISALMNAVSASSSLSEIIQNNPKVNVKISIKNPLDRAKTAIEYVVKNCTIDSQSGASSIGSDTTADLTLTSQIGSSNDNENGVFAYSEIVSA